MSLALESEFQVKRLTAADEDVIAEFIKSSRHNSSLFQYQNEDARRLDKYNDRLVEVRVHLKLQENLSVGVYEKSSHKLVAVMLCWVQDATSDPNKVICSLMQPVPKEVQEELEFFDKLESGLFEHLSGDKHNMKVLFAGMLTVHLQYQLRGIASFLLNKSLNLAMEAKCTYVIVVTVNDFLIKSLAKKRWLLYRECRFSDYNSDNGTSVFSTAEYPTVKAQVLYKEAKAAVVIML